MKIPAVFAAILAIANALSPSDTLAPGESFMSLIDEGYNDFPRDHNGKRCSDWEGTSITKVPRLCFESLFCSEEKLADNLEVCRFNGKLVFSEMVYSKFSEECTQQAVCNAIRAKKLSDEAKKPKPIKVRDIEVPNWARDNFEKDNFGVSCQKRFNQKVWSKTSPECVYDFLCNYLISAGEPECTSLDENKKSYTTEEFKCLPKECAREVLCQRAKGEINTEHH